MNFASKHEGDAFKRIAERAYEQDPVRTENDLMDLGLGGFARDLKLDAQIQQAREQEQRSCGLKQQQLPGAAASE